MKTFTVTLTEEEMDALSSAIEEAYDSLYEASRCCDHETEKCEPSAEEPDGYLCHWNKKSDLIGKAQMKLQAAEPKEEGA